LQVKHAVVFTHLQGSTCKCSHPGYANTDAKVLVGKCQSPRLKTAGYGLKVPLFTSELVVDKTHYHAWGNFQHQTSMETAARCICMYHSPSRLGKACCGWVLLQLETHVHHTLDNGPEDDAHWCAESLPAVSICSSLQVPFVSRMNSERMQMGPE